MQTNTKLVLLWQNKFAYMKIQIEYSDFVIDWSQFQSKTEYILQFHSPYLNRAHDKKLNAFCYFIDPVFTIWQNNKQKGNQKLSSQSTISRAGYQHAYCNLHKS